MLQCQAGAGVEHQRHCGTARPGRTGNGQRPLAGLAAGRFAAGLAGQRRGIAGAGHLNQDGAAFQSFLGRAPGGAREACNPGQGVTFHFKAVGRVEHPGNGPSDHGALSLHGPAPSPPPPGAPFRCCGMRHEQARGAFLLRAEQEDFTGVGVRGALLHVEIVAVVPAHHEAEVPDRCVGCGPGAHRHAGSAVEDRR